DHVRPCNLKPRQRDLTPVLRRPVEPARGRADLLALDVAGVLQPLSKSAQTFGSSIRRCWMQEPDHPRCRGLRACCERRRRRSAAKKRDEFASLHVPTVSRDSNLAL